MICMPMFDHCRMIRPAQSYDSTPRLHVNRVAVFGFTFFTDSQTILREASCLEKQGVYRARDRCSALLSNLKVAAQDNGGDGCKGKTPMTRC